MGNRDCKELQLRVTKVYRGYMYQGLQRVTRGCNRLQGVAVGCHCDILAKSRYRMTTAITFSRQNDVGSRARTT